MHELPDQDRPLVAAQLADVPEHCIARHALLSGRGPAYVVGEPGRFDALVIDPSITAGELLAFGNAEAIARVVRELRDWCCVEVSPVIADQLEPLLCRDMRLPIRRTRDLYFTLTGDIPQAGKLDVRLLTPADADDYARSTASYCSDPANAHRNVIEGPVVAAFIDGRVVAAVEANARTQRYANFNVRTLPEYRGRGLATAVSAVAAFAVRSMGLTPLWSCSDQNVASQRVAQKLGFTPVAHCVYLIPERVT